MRCTIYDVRCTNSRHARHARARALSHCCIAIAKPNNFNNVPLAVASCFHPFLYPNMDSNSLSKYRFHPDDNNNGGAAAWRDISAGRIANVCVALRQFQAIGVCVWRSGSIAIVSGLLVRSEFRLQLFSCTRQQSPSPSDSAFFFGGEQINIRMCIVWRLTKQKTINRVIVVSIVVCIILFGHSPAIHSFINKILLLPFLRFYFGKPIKFENGANTHSI